MIRFLALLFLALPAFAADYLDELQSRARQLNLASDPQWHVLVHYARQPILAYTRSLADDAGFFNAPDGQTNPQAELDATLARFSAPRPSRRSINTRNAALPHATTG